MAGFLHRHQRLQRRLGKSDQFRLGVGVDIEAKHPVEPGRVARALLAGLVAARIVHGLDDIGVIEQGDFLLGVVAKPQQRLARAQPVEMGEGFQRAHRGAAAVASWSPRFTSCRADHS